MTLLVTDTIANVIFDNKHAVQVTGCLWLEYSIWWTCRLPITTCWVNFAVGVKHHDLGV